jgi:hypothetical protein
MQHASIDTIKLSSKVASNVKATKDGRIIKFHSKYNFQTFATKLFEGKASAPDFTNNEFSNDTAYVKFIEEGCKKNQINFGGHYTIFQRSCGAMCSNIFIIDRHNGKIVTDIKPNDGRYGYLFKKDSKLLIANSSVFQDDSFKYYNDLFGAPELYVWTGDNFKLLR